MGKDEYATAGGGALKLKGAKNAAVEKKRKKQKRGKTKPAEEVLEAVEAPAVNEKELVTKDEELDLRTLAETDLREAHKTEAERRHEETRRKRVRQAER